MGDAGEIIAVQPRITSREHEEILNTIDKIRDQGISRYIDIPQIVVCGDQSSGKSSTLEAICGLRFEVGDGLCTRHATEYVLRRTERISMVISIVPDVERPENEQKMIASWQPTTTSPDEFGKIMSEGAIAMGIGQNGKTFSQDRLRIEVSGPTQPHLTLVDVPGLFHARGKGQNDADKATVYSLVESYIKNPRSIIMAVISAKNDKENQIVITFAEKYDPNGNRTIGVITKPDTLAVNSPSEAQYHVLAQNKDFTTRFALGWAVVRNRSFEEQGSSPSERDEMEKQFFDQGLWKSLDSETKGVLALRRRLGKILHNHILTEMPSMLKDVDAGIKECEQKLAALGTSRGAPDDQRLYLLQASMKFGSLMKASNDGVYTDAFFGSGVDDKDFQKRVCANSVAILDQFRDEINRNGHAIQIVETIPSTYKLVAGKPRKMLEDDFFKHVEFVMHRNRGRELPGLFNPTIVKPLFLDQSQPWRALVMKTLDELLDVSRTTVRLILETTADETTVDGILSEIVNPAMEPIEEALKAKAKQDLVPYENWPSTYNHYFTDNLQKRREDQLMKSLDKSLYGFLGVHPADEDMSSRMYKGDFDVRALRNALKQETEKSMTRFAAVEASNAMFAYYKVALKKITDTFAIDTMNEYLINKLSTLFTPETVVQLDKEVITRIAGESEQSVEARIVLNKKLAALREAQKIGYRMHRHKAQDLALRPHRFDDTQEGERESD